MVGFLSGSGKYSPPLSGASARLGYSATGKGSRGFWRRVDPNVSMSAFFFEGTGTL